MTPQDPGHFAGARSVPRQARWNHELPEQTMKAVRTMDAISTVMDTTEQARAHVSRAPSSCWCGQDLEYVRCGYCPRCGSTFAGALESLQIRLAG